MTLEAGGHGSFHWELQLLRRGHLPAGLRVVDDLDADTGVTEGSDMTEPAERCDVAAWTGGHGETVHNGMTPPPDRLESFLTDRVER